MFYKLLVFIGSHLHSTMMKISFLNVVLYHIQDHQDKSTNNFLLLVGTMAIYSYFLLFLSVVEII